MKVKCIWISLLTSSLLITGCNNVTSIVKKEEKTTATHEVNYKDQKNWELESGDTQSPIDIETTKTQEMKDSGAIELNYNKAVLVAEDNGHSIQLGVTGTAKINGRNFDLKQFHIHAPSEHKLDGKHYPIEVHFVNKAQDGRLAVIGVFFKEGAENQGFKKVIDSIKKGDKNTSVGEINIATMLPANKSYYHYLGSLTTPPLSENVEWYVMKNPVDVSKAQIETFQSYYNGNNRDIQPLNKRLILKYEE
ncbi:carbonic anhydrase family protein [Peribacillus muralis]|uniref:carbonic anhydrase n=1 Tax=Peribacillus muralis TaxID=264697 RepID=UPI001F4D3B8E|nr:carbonic anhydrase family protein [Peribacillus muralis]MCK1993941.1 carbonic anhydrase family protein [Peribacillus muralis]MCK2014496.1 carbonic anhydrase family protein [Peribacillus muralis]